MSIEIRMFSANKGDCIWIRNIGEQGNYNVIVDSGTKTFYKKFKKVLEEIKKNNENVDLLIITHCDNDHIGGFFRWLQHNHKNKNIDFVKEVWINDARYIKDNLDKGNVKSINREYSVQDAISAISYMDELGIPYNNLVKTGDYIKIGDMELVVVSPTADELHKLDGVWADEIKKKNILYSKEVDTRKDLEDLILQDDYQC